MKRVFLRMACFVLAASAVALCACAGVSVRDIDVVAVGASLRDEFVAEARGYTYSSDSDIWTLDEDMVRSVYGDAGEMPDYQSLTEYFVYLDTTTPTDPCEFGIFKLNDQADKALFRDFLKARVAMLLANAKNYPSVKTGALKTAELGAQGNYVWYFVISGRNAEANSRLVSLLNGDE